MLKKNGKFFIKTFSNLTWGCGTGEKKGHNAWNVSEGPLAYLGYGRFTTEDDLKILFNEPLILTNIEKSTITIDNRKKLIDEWVLTGKKL